MKDKTAPWVIVGGGPVGEMQAVLLGAIFPKQNIYIIDKERDVKRQHGLLIWPETIEHIIHQLDQIRKHLEPKGQEIDPGDNHTRITKINETIDFLKKNFLQNRNGTFIPTQALIEKLRSLSTKRPNIHYRSDEVTTSRLNFSEDHEITNLLKTASLILGADGARSIIRKDIFLDPEGNENKKIVAGYIIEIKFKARAKKSSFIKDQINKTVLPTLFRGNFHVWMQSKDNSTTLRIFIDKEVYDKLRNKRDNKGRAYGTFANPYRRLIDLPKEFREAIAEVISSVIGDQNIEHDTIKITTLALSTFTAKRLVTVRNETLYALVGDAAAGLVLARGLNNGLECSMEYAAAMYYSSLHEEDFVKSFSQYETLLQDHILLIDSYCKYLIQQLLPPNENSNSPVPTSISGAESPNAPNRFPEATPKAEQLADSTASSNLPLFNTDQPIDPDLANLIKKIRDKYLYIFNQITDHPARNKQKHYDMVTRLAKEFEDFVNNLLPNTLTEEKWKKILFEKLINNTSLLGKPKSEFHIAEENSQTITEKNLNAIRQNTSYLGLYNSLLGCFSVFKPKSSTKAKQLTRDESSQPLTISEIEEKMSIYKNLLKDNESLYIQTFSVEWYYLSQRVYVELDKLISSLLKDSTTRHGVYLDYLTQLDLIIEFLSSNLEDDLENKISSFSQGIVNPAIPYKDTIPSEYLKLLFKFVDETYDSAYKQKIFSISY